MFGLACDQLVRPGWACRRHHAWLAILLARSTAAVKLLRQAGRQRPTPPGHFSTPLLLLSLLQIGLEMVDYKGNVVTANSTHNSELLWASCGGGGGLGVVTRWTVKAHDLGTEPFSRITVS